AGMTNQSADPFQMSATAYAELNDGTHVMDGQRAWRHLVSGLGMRAVPQADSGVISETFAAWLERHGEAINVRGDQATFLLPPTWYAPEPVVLSATTELSEIREAD